MNKSKSKSKAIVFSAALLAGCLVSASVWADSKPYFYCQNPLNSGTFQFTPDHNSLAVTIDTPVKNLQQFTGQLRGNNNPAQGGVTDIEFLGINLYDSHNVECIYNVSDEAGHTYTGTYVQPLSQSYTFSLSNGKNNSADINTKIYYQLNE